MGSLSIWHLLLLALLLLVFFGPSRLPQAGESVGKAIRGFKKGLSGADDEDSRDVSQQLSHENKDSVAPKQKVKQTDEPS